jgi:hypothetical protein
MHSHLTLCPFETYTLTGLELMFSDIRRNERGLPTRLVLVVLVRELLPKLVSDISSSYMESNQETVGL